MHVRKNHCGACESSQLVIRLSLDEAVALAREIRNSPGPWPGPFSERMVEQIEKITR